MMYVEGNPVSYRDPSGNKISTPLAWGLLGYLAAPTLGLTKEEGFFFGASIGLQLIKKRESGNDLDRIFKSDGFFDRASFFKVDLNLFVTRIWQGITKAFTNTETRCDLAGARIPGGNQPDPTTTNTGSTGNGQPQSPGSQTTSGPNSYIILEGRNGECQVTPSN
jgi:hypothetical protein